MTFARLTGLVIGSAVLFFAGSAFANEAGAAASGGYGPIGAGLAIGLAALGGTLGQSKTAAAALEGLARNPQANLFMPMVLGLALIESLVILSWLVANNLAR